MASLRTPAPPPPHLHLHLHLHNRTFSLFSPRPRRFTFLRLSRNHSTSYSGKLKSTTFRETSIYRRSKTSFHCVSESKTEIEKVEVSEGVERPPFDINLAVILAGFAFEAYTTPPENVGRREMDAAGCKTVYLSESFVREIYDGQLLIKLKKGIQLPAMDPWGTSDPYVIMELDGQIVKSKIKWGKKEPTWNEDFTFNLKLPPGKRLQVAAWDANLVTPHKRMGNAGIDLESLCDGNLHEMLVELEGMGGGGKIQLEVRFKGFEEIEEEGKWWNVPFVAELLQKNGFGSALKSVVGSEAVPVREFVEYAFGQLKSINETNSWKDKFLKTDNYGKEGPSSTIAASEEPSPVDADSFTSLNDQSTNVEETTSVSFEIDSGDNGHAPATKTKVGKPDESDKQFWKNFADKINLDVVQKLGVHLPDMVKWDGLDLLNRIGIQSQKIAEENYIEAGLATSETLDVNDDKKSGPVQLPAFQASLPDIKKVTQDLLQQTDIKKVTQDLLQQTDSVLGAFMVLTATVSRLSKDSSFQGKKETRLEDDSNVLSENDKLAGSSELLVLDEKKAEEMKALFSTAESAMEAWAMLATSLGHPSFIKSEFEKICFLDNATTDTQVAIWRDSARRRLVIAFRGTEQSRWKDLRTDLMLVPAGLNPERIGGDFKQEVQVHSGFLSAYDSVRIRIISLLKMAIGYREYEAELKPKWHVYVTGHSLGGALATLLALELSSSQLAKHGAICLTMYNFGSPRVGNKRFAELYNEKVKDSWRVVNHRDIIPSVPRLMGYCHVAQPIYLGARTLQHAMENMELLGDGYEGDVIGEYTPDVLVSEFMKGEKELIEKILLTEINIYRSIRDGSALMQHMEDFYYITLLELVRSNYQTAERMQDNLKGSKRELTA